MHAKAGQPGLNAKREVQVSPTTRPNMVKNFISGDKMA